MGVIIDPRLAVTRVIIWIVLTFPIFQARSGLSLEDVTVSVGVSVTLSTFVPEQRRLLADNLRPLYLTYNWTLSVITSSQDTLSTRA